MIQEESTLSPIFRIGTYENPDQPERNCEAFKPQAEATMITVVSTAPLIKAHHPL